MYPTSVDSAREQAAAGQSRSGAPGLGAPRYLYLCACALLISGCALDDREPPPLVPGESAPGRSGEGDAAAVTTVLDLRPCTPGESSCVSSTDLVECREPGAWSEPLACQYVCREGRCDGQCRPEQVRCLSTTRRQQCSLAGTWSTPEECPSACVEGGCAGSCVPGAQRCVDDTDVQVCSEAGEWGAARACANGCSGAGCVGECTAATTECFSESQLRLCNDLGQWQTPVTCPLSCREGACQGECVPDSVRCQPDSGAAERCDATGAWQRGAECAPGGACPLGAVARCGDVCTSLDDNPQHCGACDHDCGGGDCVAGSCRPVVLGSGFTSPSSVVLSDTHVYFRDGAAPARIVRIPKQGGAAEVVVPTGITVVPALGSVPSLGIAGNQLYFTMTGAGTAGRVQRANLDGSGVVGYSPEHADGIGRLITPGLFVYYTAREAGDTVVFRASLLSEGQTGEGSEATFETTPGPLLAMTVVNGCLYYVDQGAPRQLLRKCGPAEMTQVRYSGNGTLGFHSSGANDGEFLYFVEEGRGLLRIPLSSTGAEAVLATGAVSEPTAADDALYYVAPTAGPTAPGCSTSNALMRGSKQPGAGGPSVVLAPPLACPTQLAVDDAALYWSTGDGRVLRVSRANSN